jgi:hypothetical protein
LVNITREDLSVRSDWRAAGDKRNLSASRKRA